MDRLENDHHSRRTEGVRRDRAKSELAKGKQFALRGLRGGDFSHLKGAERGHAMVLAARKARIKSGTQVPNKALRRFMETEEIGPTLSRRPVLPWNRSRKRAPNVADPGSAALTPESLSHAYRKFLRDGSVPAQEVYWTAKRPEWASAKVERRFKTACAALRSSALTHDELSVSGTVELNPGPGSAVLRLSDLDKLSDQQRMALAPDGLGLRPCAWEGALCEGDLSARTSRRCLDGSKPVARCPLCYCKLYGAGPVYTHPTTAPAAEASGPAVPASDPKGKRPMPACPLPSTAPPGPAPSPEPSGTASSGDSDSTDSCTSPDSAQSPEPSETASCHSDSSDFCTSSVWGDASHPRYCFGGVYPAGLEEVVGILKAHGMGTYAYTRRSNRLFTALDPVLVPRAMESLHASAVGKHVSVAPAAPKPRLRITRPGVVRQVPPPVHGRPSPSPSPRDPSPGPVAGPAASAPPGGSDRPPSARSGPQGPGPRPAPPPAEAPGAPAPASLSVLRGQQLSYTDKRRALARHMAPGFWVTTRSVVLDYRGERRVVSNRNVVETKAPFEIVEITGYAVLAHVLAIAAILFLVVLGHGMAAPQPGSTWQSRAAGNVARGFGWLRSPRDNPVLSAACAHRPGRPVTLGGFDLSELICSQATPEPGPDYAAWSLAACRAGLVAAFVAVLYLWWCTPKRFAIAYVPHIVSCVLTEYRSGTNSVAAATTMRQRVLRLATLPLPDLIHCNLVWGTEEACSVLLDDQSFFGEGVLRALPRL